MSTPDPHQGGVSTREAAAILGTSTSDVLRRIRAGTLRAERFTRNGGTYYTVYLDPPGAASDPHQLIESAPAPEPRQAPSIDATRLLDKLDERDETIRDQTETIRSQGETIAELRERVGRAETRAEAESTRATLAQQRADREAARADDLAAQLAAERAARARAEQDRDALKGRRFRWWPF